MKRNKLVSIAAITVALGVLATGCAGGSGSSKSDSKSSGGTKTVTVKAGTGANVKPYTYIEDGTTDLAIIDVAMYNAYQKEYNYDVVANQISDEDAKAIADNSYAYYIFPKDQEELRDKVDEQLKELKKDGTLSKLSQKYFGQDTAPEDDQFEKTPN